ncbi:exodeoxyribonuclease VII small subunit [Acetivibrio mesophilus]|uniref:Exodeoxyribonuclease 7 small subunit n=1 Tax=Acetivibrio mesophilus TaxID=2487273 RepID=A0A4Q0I5T0_9FIRM|nr:exodeoxyribonuclease VII small subunit [Acetivibrio mesophilus]ODM25309.1 exodeoxyribonuclease VII small subunit [Clostridium sp. Bc-iso-3]RXE59671.1 exodeoxyribonuclease VII small subunit [Acetivibrio mesophilus]HHV28608.1 exodeoxyribonuclease VII small subunit [Clostridium sp.]
MKKGFEESLKELESIVKQLERGELPLDESIEMFQKGITLSKDLSKMLDDMEKRVSILIEDENGMIKEENFIGAGDDKSGL